MPYTLEYLADRLEIDDLLTLCATAVDRRDWRLFESCFAADATVDYAAMGGAAVPIEAASIWLSEHMAHVSMSQHMLINREVSVDSDEAKCRSVVRTVLAVPSGQPREQLLHFAGGYYWDELARMPEGWRIRRRVEQLSYDTFENPVSSVQPWGT